MGNAQTRQGIKQIEEDLKILRTISPEVHRPTLRGLQLGSTLGPPSILQLHHSSRSDASDLSSCLSQPPHPVTVGIT